MLSKRADSFTLWGNIAYWRHPLGYHIAGSSDNQGYVSAQFADAGRQYLILNMLIVNDPKELEEVDAE